MIRMQPEAFAAAVDANGCNVLHAAARLPDTAKRTALVDLISIAAAADLKLAPMLNAKNKHGVPPAQAFRTRKLRDQLGHRAAAAAKLLAAHKAQQQAALERTKSSGGSGGSKGGGGGKGAAPAASWEEHLAANGSAAAGSSDTAEPGDMQANGVEAPAAAKKRTAAAADLQVLKPHAETVEERAKRMKRMLWQLQSTPAPGDQAATAAVDGAAAAAAAQTAQLKGALDVLRPEQLPDRDAPMAQPRPWEGAEEEEDEDAENAADLAALTSEALKDLPWEFTMTQARVRISICVADMS